MEILVEQPHPKWSTLKIFPKLAEIRYINLLLNNLAETFKLEDFIVSVCIDSPFKEIFENKNSGSLEANLTITYTEVNRLYDFDYSDVLISSSSSLNQKFFKKISLRYNKWIYLSELVYSILLKQMYFDYSGIFNYDNLICLAMIVKNAGPEFKEILKTNINYFDYWIILDTGSTDGTQQVITEILKSKPGVLHEEPFVNFKVSRNRCLELCGNRCEYILTLDDTYIVKGDLRKFLNETRGDTFADSFSLMIQSNDSEYYSNRIIKSRSGLRYIHTIHEVITDQNNINVSIPPEEAYIFDVRSEYMEQRTTNRKQLDLDLLFKELETTPDDPRTIYYIGQTYGCMNDEIQKAKYFEQRIKVDGYVQEKIDALFELARCYNFKVNCETLTLKKNGDTLTNKQWQRCEELYRAAYQLDTTRPDSLYFIGIHYYLEGDYNTAYINFKKALEVGYPIHSQYSLKPTLSYHFLPRFLTEICYYVEDYQLGLKAAELFLTKNTIFDQSWNLVHNWYKIHLNLVKMPQVKSNILVIVTDGGWEPWTGRTIETKGLGGSETWIIETARHLQHDFNVVVFCNTDKSEIYNGVGYNPINLFHEFIATTPVEHCIISRFTEYIPVALKGLAKNVSVIFHDIIPSETIVPVHPKIKLIFGLTRWHQQKIKTLFPQFNVNYINYGIDKSEINGNKLKNNFIYSSFPNRGLVVLLNMWPRIKEIIPDATLSVYCNLQQEWVNQVAPEMMKEIKESINQKDITNYGWVDKQTLMRAWNNAEYWLYPCIFEETFCLTALEAAISRTLPITNGLAALSETARNGIIIDGDPLSTTWQLRCLAKLKRIIKNDNLRNTILDQNYKMAESMNWESQTEKFKFNLVN